MSFYVASMLMVLTLMIVVSVVSGIVTPDEPETPQGSQGSTVPCYFVFGDSLSEAGNNNNLETLAKANYMPYGIDFPDGVPTGRFSNNRNYVDIITQLLGFSQYIPPFNPNMRAEDARIGVNYASGGSGILLESGRNLGEVVSFGQQIQNHYTVYQKISNDVDLTKCLYTINIGSNDYINNYFMNETYETSKIYTPAAFATHLIEYYRPYVNTLTRLGARKIAVYLLSEIGCALGEIAYFGATACVEEVNNAVALFNGELVSLVNELKEDLPYCHFTYINSSAIDTSAFITQGITVFDQSCCTPRSDGQCEPNTTPCSNRDEHYFWDLFHPTDAVSIVVGGRAYQAQSTLEANPYDISSLVKL